jgi:hypothetical protein
LNGSARFFNFGAHFFHLDFILAQYVLRNTVPLPLGEKAPAGFPGVSCETCKLTLG